MITPDAIVRFRVRLLLGPLLASMACSSPDLNGPASLDPARLPWIMTLNTHAITMSTLPPYDTLQLTAVARTVTGTPLADGPAVTFTSLDSTVRVSATGLLTARTVATQVPVVASIVYNGVRISDTAFVSVTDDTLQKATQVQIALQPGDSPQLPAWNILFYLYYDPSFTFGFKTINVGALDATGTRIPAALVEVRTSDPSRISLGFEAVRSILSDPSLDLELEQIGRPGPVTIYASATVYGTVLRDSLLLVVTNPMVHVFDVRASSGGANGALDFTLIPATQDRPLGVGGWAWWVNEDRALGPDDSLDIVFDDSTVASPDATYLNSGGGNIAPFPGDTFYVYRSRNVRSRQFLRAGRFHWHSPRTGVSGTVIVQ